MTVSEGLVMGLVLVCVGYVWGHAYSDEEEVVTYVARMMLLIAASYFFDGIQCPLADCGIWKDNTLWTCIYVSAARGCGWQKIGAWVNLGAFYAVGGPAAYLIAFVLRIGGMGLWTGIICGVVVQVVMLVIITVCTGWHKRYGFEFSVSATPSLSNNQGPEQSIPFLFSDRSRNMNGANRCCSGKPY
ncbi:hypothetical protein EJB05_44915, partial [Eragrostis curvula]